MTFRASVILCAVIVAIGMLVFAAIAYVQSRPGVPVDAGYPPPRVSE